MTSRLALLGASADLKFLLLLMAVSNLCTVTVPLSWLVGPTMLFRLLLNISILANMTMLRVCSRWEVRVNAVVQPLVLFVIMTRLQLPVPRCGRNMSVGVPIVCNAALALLRSLVNVP